MIITKIRGGLGNQLFTYAAGRALSLTNTLPLVLDTSWYRSGARPFLLNHFRIAGTISLEDHSGASDGVGFNQTHWQYDPSFEHVDGSRFISGRWQSEKFFESHSPEIKKDLQFRNGKYAATAAAKIQSIGRGGLVTSVHCRRADYLPLADEGRFRILGQEYYRAAMNLFPSGTVFLLFSDDPEWCRANLENANARVLDAPDTLGAFSLMQACHHHIIANSTFSWWAAWLGEVEGTIVVSPPAQEWFGPKLLEKWDTRDMIPERWFQVSG